MQTLSLTPTTQPIGDSHVRTSSYVIYVDLPNDPTRMLLVHGYTGAYDNVSRSVAGYVRSRETTPAPKPLYGTWEPEEIDALYAETPREDTIALLKRRGYLTTKTEPEEQAMFVKYVDALQEHYLKSIPSYVMMPTYSCNLRCGYCFQDHMRTNPAFSHLLRIISREMIDRTIGALSQLEELNACSPSEKNRRPFTLFGGEPLLEQSLPAVEYFMERAKAAAPSTFGAVTNGTDLESYRHLLGPENISFLQITLDGPREAHDKRRIYADGSGSFDRITKNVKMALDLDVIVSIRMNIDRNNINDVPVLAQHFIQQGWTTYKNFSAYTAPVTDSTGTGNRKQLFNTWELSEAQAELAETHAEISAIMPVDDQMRTRALGVFTRRGDAAPAKVSFCGAHVTMYIFDAFGDIYACWERTGDKNIRVGYIAEDGKLTLNGFNDEWRKRTVASNPTCSRCRFALHCGGGCAILAEASSGTMFRNYCDAFGKRFRAKVAQAYGEFTAGGKVDDGAMAAAAMQEFVR